MINSGFYQQDQPVSLSEAAGRWQQSSHRRRNVQLVFSIAFYLNIAQLN